MLSFVAFVPKPILSLDGYLLSVAAAAALKRFPSSGPIKNTLSNGCDAKPWNLGNVFGRGVKQCNTAVI